MFIIGNFEVSAVWIWLLAAVVMVIIEALTMGLTTIWFAGGALAASVVSFVTDIVWIQLLVFVAVSAVLVYFTRPLAVKKLNRETVKTNVDAVVGSAGIAESDIRRYEKGTVKADNKTWTAVLDDESPDIVKGDLVTVTAVQGVKLIVRKGIRE